MNFRPKAVVIALLLTLALCAPVYLLAQSTTLGAIRGTVTDPSGAVIPNATVTVHSDDTGLTITRKTTGTGLFEFNLLPPGHYTVTTKAANYQATSQHLVATVGQVTESNIKLSLATQNQTVTVTAEGGVINTVAPNISTSMSTEQIQLVPNGGGDLSYIAQTAPGATMNSQGGYGNFSTFGLPALANNFTVNSMPENDPFLNLNNSGATNILLGSNDVSEATVVNNAYSGEYSGAGANVNYLSRSGTNSWHGNAIWRWNGSYVDANSYFNKHYAPITPKPFVNDNQWAASFGGPIVKNKTFVFLNTEGLYLIVPVTNSVKVPSPAFQTAVLGNIGATQPGELTFYQNLFNLYNNAPGAATASNSVPGGGCGTFTAPGVGGAAGAPCALQYSSAVNTGTHEWLFTARVDQNIGASDKAFAHFRVDHGLQATYTDPLSPLLNATSSQPQYEGQAQWIHTFGASTVNSFNFNASHYSAIFDHTNPTAALNLLPLEVAFSGSRFYSAGRDYGIFPQGRVILQYGAVDDFSHTMGNHTLKFGGQFSRYNTTTYGPGIGTVPIVFGETLTDFYNGVASNYSQSFPNSLTEPINLYNFGVYGMDTWRLRNNLTLTLTMRADYNSNPVCTTGCFNRFNGNFESIDHGLTTPYNQVIQSGLHEALPSSFNRWTLEPRFGFNWSPFGPDAGLVLSGGFGLFGSQLPAVFSDNLISNLPGDPSFTVGGMPYAPGVAGNAQGAASAAATALKTGFANGATWADLNTAVTAATGTGFPTPNFFNAANNIHTPRIQEWDLQMEKSIGNTMSLTLKYVGNHGIWEQINNTGLNAYCGDATTTPITAGAGATPCLTALGVTSFAGLPTTPMDPRFNIVTQFNSGYNSNYNGLTASFARRFSALQLQFNYTWSHALDYASNGGNPNEPFNFNTNVSVASPQDPFHPFANMYGNADYDVRHYFSANYVYSTPRNLFNGFLGKLVGDWTIAGTVFAHTGLPFTITDGLTGPTLASYGYGGVDLNNSSFANQTGALNGVSQCGTAYVDLAPNPCPVIANNFAPDTAGFGNQRRNQVYGPNFFDTDMTISKAFPIPHWEAGRLSIGATAYNLFNHPNFDQPVQDITSSSSGYILSTVNPPTSIYGAFLGANSSPRLLQSEIKLVW